MPTLVLLALLACASDKDGDDTGPGGGASDGGSDGGGSATDGGGDGGGSADGGSDGGSDGGGSDGGGEEACTASLVSTVPEDGAKDVYWRDPLVVTLDSSAHDATFSLMDSGGTAVPLSESWDDDALVATLEPEDGLQPETVYLLTVDVCGASSTAAFATSAEGSTLVVAPEDLVGRTYHFDTPAADWVEPAGIGTLLRALLEAPLLVGVTAASEGKLDLLGAMGSIGGSRVSQDLRQPTWDLPPGGFDEAPYFEAQAERITFTFESGTSKIEIPIQDFEVEGTFTPDGDAITGGKTRGLADTRYMGDLLDLGDSPTAICEMFTGFGWTCEACSDGVESCIFLEVHFTDAPVVEGLELRVVE